MRKIIPVFMLIGLIGLIFLSLRFDLQQRAPTISITCKLSLQVFTRRGTNAKYNISGWVVVDGANLIFDGKLSQEKESSDYPITLYFDGPVVHFVISTKYGRIFGEGTSEGSLKACSGEAGGTQSGPTWDDEGDWRGKWKSERKKIPPLPIEITLFKWVCVGLPTIFVLGWLMGKQSTKDE